MGPGLATWPMCHPTPVRDTTFLLLQATTSLESYQWQLNLSEIGIRQRTAHMYMLTYTGRLVGTMRLTPSASQDAN